MSWVARAVQLASASPISVGLLIVANLVPLVGVLFLGWSVAMVLVTYWLESGVVGLINIPKIVLAGRARRDAPIAAASIGLSVFFVFHYGIFWLVHGVFVFVLTGGFLAAPNKPWIDGQSVLLLAALLLISHGASFFVNYVGRAEYRRTTPAAQMIQPYGRVFILQFTIVLGGFVVILAGQPVVLVVLLVVLKTLGDLVLHLREHRTAPPAAVIA